MARETPAGNFGRLLANSGICRPADAVVEILSHPEQRQAMVARASAYATSHSWESRKGDYLKIVDDLCARRSVQGLT